MTEGKPGQLCGCRKGAEVPMQAEAADRRCWPHSLASLASFAVNEDSILRRDRDAVAEIFAAAYRMGAAGCCRRQRYQESLPGCPVSPPVAAYSSAIERIIHARWDSNRDAINPWPLDGKTAPELDCCQGPRCADFLRVDGRKWAFLAAWLPLTLAAGIVVVPSGMGGIRVSQTAGTRPGILY